MELFFHIPHAILCEENFGDIYFWIWCITNTGWAKNRPNFKSGQKWFFLSYIIFSKFFYGIQFRCWVYIKKYHFELGTYGWTRGPILKFHLIFCTFDQGKKCLFNFFGTFNITFFNFIFSFLILLRKVNILV